MSIKDEFATYIDGNGLCAPTPVAKGVLRASDNGPMFTSEMYIIMSKNNQLVHSDVLEYSRLIQTCVGADNELHRSPGDTTPDEVDDHYGAYSAHVILGIKPTFKLPIRLWRQPQLLFASLKAKHPTLAILLSPILAPVTALVIATSCIGKDPSDADSRRLSWHLIQAVKSNLLCKLASYIWFWRLKKDYGANQMKAVAAEYYLWHGIDNNPYSKYWIS